MAAVRIIAIILVIAALIALGFYGMSRNDPAGAEGVLPVTIKGKTFELEIAASPENIERGMMFRESIADRGGMIFVFLQPERRTFWMKNCLVDIDLLYLDDARRVIQIEHMKHQPPQGDGESTSAYEARIHESASYPAQRPVSYAIELKAGVIEELSIEVGDRVDFDHLRLREIAMRFARRGL